MDNTQRRKWDREEYAAKAADRKREEARRLPLATLGTRAAAVSRAPRAQDEAADEARRAKVSASLGLVVRKPLSVEGRIERDYSAELRARVGTKQLVNPDTQEGAGFLCKESGKLMRDSISYLDHINGKKRACPRKAIRLRLLAPAAHARALVALAEMRALGMSMRVERSTLEEVQARFEENKRLKAAETQAAPSARPARRVCGACGVRGVCADARTPRRLRRACRVGGGGGRGAAARAARAQAGGQGTRPRHAHAACTHAR